MRHIPVLQKEVLEALSLKSGDNVVDCTLGDGGHAEAMLSAIEPDGRLLGIDADPESLLRAKRYLYRFGEQALFARDNFVNLEKIVAEHNFFPIQAVLMDLGWSSPQFEERNRGFSFEPPLGGDEPLDMRYTPANGTTDTAAKIINQWSIKEIEEIFRRFGEEKYSQEIAEAIDLYRNKEAIETTKQLVGIILGVYRNKLYSTKEVPWLRGNIHPATKVFQALRIVVNQELEVLKQALPQALKVLSTKGRLAVITFHSLEDRIVKQYFQSLPVEVATIITKKPIVASEDEVVRNPRSRSAKLRILEKL